MSGANVAEGVEVLLEEDIACNEDTLEPGNEDVRIEEVDVDIAVKKLELICVDAMPTMKTLVNLVMKMYESKM